METKKIFVVVGYGGEWEDKWEHIEAAFTSKESAEAYIKDNNESGKDISDELWDEIQEYLAEEEYKLQCQYYDPTTAQLRKDVKEEDYMAADEEFDQITKYELLKEKYNIEKEDYDKKEHDRDYDFVGYMIRETDLFIDEKE